MKKRRRFPAFFGGMFITLLICATVTTAFAASGAITFNAVNVSFDSLDVSKKDESMKTASGADIPSSILYTDEKGGNTTYIPIGIIAEAYQLPVKWDESPDRVNASVDGKMQLHSGPSWSTAWTLWDSNGAFSEVKPMIPQGGKTVLSSVNHQSTEPFLTSIPLTRGNGRYVNVTVINHNNKPVVFGLGTRDEVNTTLCNAEIPAGETMTRTVEIIASDDQANNVLYVAVGYPFTIADVLKPIDITVSAVQFNG